MARRLHNYWMTNRPTSYDPYMPNLQPPEVGQPPRQEYFNQFSGFQGLGDVDAAAQAKQDALNQFNPIAAGLMTQVNIAFQRLASSGIGQDVVNTLGNNINRLGAIGAQVNSGDVNQIPAYGKVASGLLDSMNSMTDTSPWDNWPTVSDWLQQILNIPAMLEAALLAIASAAGKTVHEVAAGVGVDSSLLPSAIDSLANKIILGAVVLGIGYLVVNKLF